MFPSRECVVCGIEFRPMKANGKTCSGKCRTKLWWERTKGQNKRFAKAVAGDVPLADLVPVDVVAQFAEAAGLVPRSKPAGKKRGRPRKPDSELKHPRRSKSPT